MDWKDIAGVVGKAAPIVGTLLGGPAGAAVGGMVAAALGTEATPDAVSAALVGNPDAIVKIQELQTNAKVQLQQLAVTAEQNRLADIQNARARQTANPTDHTPQWLAGGITAGFFGCLGAVMLAPLRQDVHDLLLVMVGALQTAWIAVVSYYFGSSKDSREKTQMIADVGNAAASAPVNITTPAQTQPVAQPQPDLYRGS
jgi:hypothetical protein